MRKTACPVVWEGWRAQSRQPDPIRKANSRIQVHALRRSGTRSTGWF
jgi:hypothetical protein